MSILVDEVSLGSQEQTRGIEQVWKAVQQMEEVIESNAAQAEEGAVVSSELANHAKSMEEIALELRTVVVG